MTWKFLDTSSSVNFFASSCSPCACGLLLFTTATVVELSVRQMTRVSRTKVYCSSALRIALVSFQLLESVAWCTVQVPLMVLVPHDAPHPVEEASDVIVRAAAGSYNAMSESPSCSLLSGRAHILRSIGLLSCAYHHNRHWRSILSCMKWVYFIAHLVHVALSAYSTSQKGCTFVHPCV